MIVHVDTDSSITLEEPDTFTAFSIRAPGLDVEEIVAALGDDGKAGEGDHVWIGISRLHALGGRYGAPDWRGGCDKMIAYAASQGWVDEAHQRVRAHIER